MTKHARLGPSARYCYALLSVLVLLCVPRIEASSPNDSVAALAAGGSSAANPAATAASTTDVAAAGGGGGNPAVQLVGYLKDSVVRTVDGVQLMWKNYGRCNEIRGKQKQHREVLRAQWESEGMSNQVIKQKLKNENGGITYDEYAFLIKGKEDRGKLTQLAFLSWGAPRFLPYAIMFYPEMLPSAFSSPKVTATEKLETNSRLLAHTVVQTLMNMENAAKQIPPLAKLNIFGRKKQERTMEEMQRLGQLAASLFVTPVKNTSEGAELVLKTLQDDLYKEVEDFDSNSKRLVPVPKTIIKGLATSLGGNSPLDLVFPLFITRGKVLNHIKKVTDSDEFLVNEKVDLDQLGKQRLLEACKDRLIGEIGRTDDEMRASLADWLDQVVVKPSDRISQTGEFYNGNLARAAMMCYSAAQAAKDDRSSSYLPRLLFQGQLTSVPESRQPVNSKELKDGSKKNRANRGK